MLKNLQHLRIKKGLSLSEMGEIVGRKKSIVFNWENEFIQIKSGDLIKLSEYFKVSTDYLLDRSDKTFLINELINELSEIDCEDLLKYIKRKLEANLNEKSVPQE